VVLAGLAAVSVALRAILAGEVHGPFVFMDELGYARMAQSFAHTGHLTLFGKTGLAYSPLYPVVLSPFYALTSSADTAYESAKILNAVLMSLAVFPVYGIARSVLNRLRAVG
jgi:asparagine N-glycosylation enzyme membrane subunit Stt3